MATFVWLLYYEVSFGFEMKEPLAEVESKLKCFKKQYYQ